jgi:hypothetical protein
MIRKFATATVLSAALALAPTAPAVASPDGEDYARVLLGLLAIGAIANALENERDREAAARRRHDPVPQPGWHDGRRRELPARCEFEVRTRHGWTEVFGKRCLEEQGVRVSRLPEACAFDVRTDYGRRSVYGAECLEDYGYRVEARRR